MLDKTVPYHPIYMVRFPAPLPSLPELPEGFCYRTYEKGDELSWAQVETKVGSFDNVKNALAYFEKEFAPRPELLAIRFGGIANEKGVMVAHAAAWEKDGNNLFHWLATDPAYQKKGLGRAAALYALHLFPDKSKPVLLHTQTNSHVAIEMYAKSGFRFVSSPVPGNEFDKTLEILSQVMSPATIERLTSNAVPLPDSITVH